MGYKYRFGFSPSDFERKRKIEAMKITEHFTWEEAKCKDGTEVPEDLRGNVISVASNIETLRKALGGVPINVHSWYRTKSYNAKIGGALNSQHLQGKAVDISTKEFTPLEIKNTIEELIKDGKMNEGGIGLYKTFVHYDIRGIKARW